MIFSVVVVPDPSGGYSAEVPYLPGCLSQGQTFEEAMTNIIEAAELWMEVHFEKHGVVPYEPAGLIVTQIEVRI